MAKYRKKPVVIEAVRWFSLNDPDDVAVFGMVGPYGIVAKAEPMCRHCNLSMERHGWIATLEGGHIVCPGDWIITGVVGELYPIKDSIFRETYEAVGVHETESDDS